MRNPASPLPTVLGLLALASPSFAQVISQVDKLYPGDPSSYDDFGRSVAVSGNLALVGCVGDDDNGSVAGAAYLIDLATGQQLHKLVASDGSQVDNFGISVDIDGSRCIVGAYADDDNGNDSGSAYVFDTATGQQLYKLLPSDGGSADYFGTAVGISGATAIVGAYRHDDPGVGLDSGAAYTFDLTTGLQIDKIVPGSAQADDQFGRSVAIEGFTAVVGAYYRNQSGGAYVIDVLSGTVLGVLVPGDIAQGDFFGFSVAMNGDRAIVGSPYDDDNGNSSGSAYVYDLTNGFLVDKLLPTDGGVSQLFGFSVALQGSTAVIGTPYDDDNGPGSGSAYLFDLDTAQQVDKFVPADGVADSRYGWTASISGSTVLVGCYHDDDNGKYSGSTYHYSICPPSLTLDANPAVAQLGDPLSYATFGGAAGLPVALAITQVNGAPTWYLFVTGTFDLQCKHTIATTVPVGLAGLEITFLSIGFTPTGLQASNSEVIQFQ